MAKLFGIGLCALGTLVTCLNFYLSFIRYLLHRRRGGTRENYRPISGIPVFGSLFLWIGAILLADEPSLMWAALAFSLLDTGGLHWFAGTVIYMSLFRRRADRT